MSDRTPKSQGPIRGSILNRNSDQNLAANLSAMHFVARGWLEMMSRRPGNGLESFLEVVCFNLTEHESVTIHGEPIHAIFGQEDMSSC